MKKALRVLLNVYTAVVAVRVFVRRNKKANLPLSVAFLSFQSLRSLSGRKTKSAEPQQQQR